jgi:hypothetical protein
VIFCKTCRETKKSACAKISWAARGPVKKNAQMMGFTDRRIARLIAEAVGSVKVVYDRNKKLGEIPPNLRHYMDDKNTYRIGHRRGNRAIELVHANAD